MKRLGRTHYALCEAALELRSRTFRDRDGAAGAELDNARRSYMTISKEVGADDAKGADTSHLTLALSMVFPFDPPILQ